MQGKSAISVVEKSWQSDKMIVWRLKQKKGEKKMKTKITKRVIPDFRTKYALKIFIAIDFSMFMNIFLIIFTHNLLWVVF